MDYEVVAVNFEARKRRLMAEALDREKQAIRGLAAQHLGMSPRGRAAVRPRER